jgi:hypothetical protein
MSFAWKGIASRAAMSLSRPVSADTPSHVPRQNLSRHQSVVAASGIAVSARSALIKEIGPAVVTTASNDGIPSGDNQERYTYAQAMAQGEPLITLILDTREPMQIGAFVGVFASLASEYERYIKRAHPDLSSEAELYVREVRPGSVVVDMLPWLSYAAPFIAEMDKALIVEQFVRVWGTRFRALLGVATGADMPQTRPELKDWADAVSAIARDPDASARLEAATFEDGKKKLRAAFMFNTSEAKQALKTIESRQRQLEKTDHADYSRVLMRFTRSDVGDVNVGRPSGERVIVDEISDKPLALIYASELAEERIKHEIREADENVFKKGFVVDVNMRSVGGRPVAYAVKHVHQVIDLPD